MKLYGIPNCDQVKKARAWLGEHDIAVEFHDFKKNGITPAIIHSWLEQIDWQILLNRRGTTWRQLSESEQSAVVDQASAVKCMINSPSIIKRPVLVVQTDKGCEVIVGFSTESYQRVFKSI